jgi:hypothetical protein
MFLTDAEEVFLSDIKEKKKETASRLNSQKHKRLGKSKIRFASDFMSRKEKIKHTKAGEIVTTNLYETILPIDDFLSLETFEQRNRLAYWRTNYSNKEIMNQMGTNNARYYKIVTELGLPQAPRTPRSNGAEKTKRKATAIKAIAKETTPEPIAQTAIATATHIEAPPAPVQELIINGLHLVYNGTFTPDQIVKQLLKFGSLLEGEEDEFYVEIKLMQKPKKEEEEN